MADPRHDTDSGAAGLVAKTLGVGLGVAGGLAYATGQAAGLWHGWTWLPVDAADAIDILTQLPAHPGDPAAAWPAELHDELPNAVGMYATAGSLVSGAIYAAAKVLYWWDRLHGRARWWRPKRQHARRHADGASWATRRDLQGLRTRDPLPGRVTLARERAHGRLLAAEPGASVIVFGPPGYHKTVGVVDPALMDWAGPAVGLSMKPDTIRATATARGRRGRVWVVDPTGLAGVDKRTAERVQWSPLAACGDWHGAQTTAKRIAETDPRMTRGSDDAFWVEQAQKPLAPLLYAAANTSGRMRDVLTWVNLRDSTPEQFNSKGEPEGPCEVFKILDGLGNPDALEEWTALQQYEPKPLDSVYITMKSLLSVWTDERVSAFSDGHTLDWQEFLSGDHTLYLYAPLHEQTHLRPLFEVLLAELIEHAQICAASQPTGALPRPLLLALDEAANVAALAGLPELVATARGAGIHLLTVWHDYAQLRGRYGDRAATVFNGHRAKLLLPGISDPELLRTASELVGDRAYSEITPSYDPQLRREHYSQTSVSYRPLLTMDALRQLREHTGILLYGNRKPARIHLRAHYTRTERLHRARSDRRLSRTVRRWDRWQHAAATVTPLVTLPGRARPEIPDPATVAATVRLPGGGERP